MTAKRDAAIAMLVCSLERAVAIEEEGWREAQEVKQSVQALHDRFIERLKGYGPESAGGAQGRSGGGLPGTRGLEDVLERSREGGRRTLDAVTALCDAYDALICLAGFVETRQGALDVAALLREVRLTEAQRADAGVPPSPTRDRALLERMGADDEATRLGARRDLTLDFFAKMEPYRAFTTALMEEQWTRKRHLLAQALDAARTMADGLGVSGSP